MEVRVQDDQEIVLEDDSSHGWLIEIIKQAPNKQWIEEYLDLVKELLDFTGLTENDPRLSVSSTKDYGIGVNVNSRHTLTSRGQGKPWAGFIFGSDFDHLAALRDRATYSHQFKPHHGEVAGKTPYILRFEGAPKIVLNVHEQKAWREAVLVELKRRKSTPYKRFHNPLAYKAVVDLEYRALVLEEAFSGLSTGSTKNRQKKQVNQFSNAQLDTQREIIEDEGYFNPENIEDARKIVHISIVQRQGQSKFRQKLLKAYSNQCAITGCDAEPALEAAHIIGYQGTETNHTANGLLLRADIHTLFDLYLLSVQPDTYEVVIAPELAGTCYQELEGQKLRMPSQGAVPNKEALHEHYQLFQVKGKIS